MVKKLKKSGWLHLTVVFHDGVFTMSILLKKYIELSVLCSSPPQETNLCSWLPNRCFLHEECKFAFNGSATRSWFFPVSTALSLRNPQRRAQTNRGPSLLLLISLAHPPITTLCRLLFSIFPKFFGFGKVRRLCETRSTANKRLPVVDKSITSDCERRDVFFGSIAVYKMSPYNYDANDIQVQSIAFATTILMFVSNPFLNFFIVK